MEILRRGIALWTTVGTAHQHKATASVVQLLSQLPSHIDTGAVGGAVPHQKDATVSPVLLFDKLHKAVQVLQLLTATVEQKIIITNENDRAQMLIIDAVGQCS